MWRVFFQMSLEWVSVVTDLEYGWHHFSTTIHALLTVEGHIPRKCCGTSFHVMFGLKPMHVSIRDERADPSYPTKYYYLVDTLVIPRFYSEAIHTLLPDPPGYFCYHEDGGSTWRLKPQTSNDIIDGRLVCPREQNAFEWLGSMMCNSKTVFVCDAHDADLEGSSQINNLAFLFYLPTVLQNLIWEYTRTFVHLLKLTYPAVSFLIASCGDHS
jgi:hypothetical protein